MSDQEGPPVEYRDLVPVFNGSLAETTVLREALAARGFEVFIPSENIKTMHPFVTGAGALAVDLVTPSEQAPEARAAIEELRTGAVRLGAQPDEADRTEQVESLGRRVRWSVCCAATIPIGAVLGAIYLNRAAGLGCRPRFHVLTVLASLFGIVVSLAALAFLFSVLVGRSGFTG